MLKPFSGKWGPKWRFREKWGSKPLTLVLRPPKSTSLRGTASFDVFCVKICARVSAVAFLENPFPSKNTQITLSRGARNYTYAETKPLNRFGYNFAHWYRYLRHYHLGLYKFWWPSVKGFLGGGGSNFPFPINFHRRPYHTLALPCQKYLIFSSPVVCCGLLWFLLRSRLWSSILCPVHVAAL